MNVVFAYLWYDEREEFYSRNDEDRRGHIFPELKRLRLWLASQARLGKGS